MHWFVAPLGTLIAKSVEKRERRYRRRFIRDVISPLGLGFIPNNHMRSLIVLLIWVVALCAIVNGM